MKNAFMVAMLLVGLTTVAQGQSPLNGQKPGVRPIHKGFAGPGLHTNANYRIQFPEITGNHVLLVSASNRAGMDILNAAKEQIMLMLRLPIKVTSSKIDGCAVEYGKSLLDKNDVVAVVIVKDDAKAPSLLALPEERIAVVNPLAYCPEGTEASIMAERLRKMVQRAYCVVMGAPIAPVFSATDLDSLGGGIPPSALSSVFRYAKALGMERMTPIAIDKDGRPVETGKAPATAATQSAPANPSNLPAVQ